VIFMPPSFWGSSLVWSLGSTYAESPVNIIIGHCKHPISESQHRHPLAVDISHATLLAALS
jgi:hypothetical protein